MPEAVTTRAALLPAAGTPLRVVELELAPPGPGEVRVRLHASGVCSDDLNAIDGSIEIPCPVVPGHEGAGVVEEIGEGVRGLAPGDHVALSWAPYCGTCEQCLRDLPHLCGTAWPLMLAGGMLDGTTRLSFGGADRPPLLLPLVVRRAGGRPRALVRPHPRGGAVRGGGAGRLRGHVGRGRGVADSRRAARRARRRLRPGRHRDVGDPRLGGGRRVARSSPSTCAPTGSSERGRPGATATVVFDGAPEDVAAAVVEASGGGVDYAFESRGRPAAVRAAFLSTRARGCGAS